MDAMVTDYSPVNVLYVTGLHAFIIICFGFDLDCMFGRLVY